MPSPARPPAASPAPSSLGDRVHALRSAGQLTLAQLASRSGLAPSSLSKIENGKMSPTYETIVRLAQGLEVDVADLFTDIRKAAPLGRRSITRRGEGALHETRAYAYAMLHADLSRKRFIPLVTTIHARSLEDFHAPPAHRGEEMIYVISGRVQLFLEHYEPIVLAAGDSCYFDSAMAHACISVSKADARVMWVCSDLSPLDGASGDTADEPTQRLRSRGARQEHFP